MSLFDGVMFFCTSTLSDKRKADLTLLLEHNGARPVPLGEATHIITLSLDYERQDSAKEGSVTVTDSWIDRSLILGKLQPVQHFSPDPAMLFSGVVACVTDLVPSDIEVLSAGITALGGQWRAGLTRDVTHLFAVGPGSEKYQTALRYQKETQVKVLVPHWFDDSVRLGIRGLSTTAYEWPEPTILTFGKPSPETGEVGNCSLRPQNKLSQDKKALYKAALMTAEQEVKLGQAETRDIWGSRRILLSPDLELSDGRRQAIEAGIIRSGGVVVVHDSQRADAEYEFDVLIARYRWGPLYVQGVNGRKLIGSLTWLFHVESTGTIGTPTAQLLHYPIPKKPIEAFSAHEITVTNYTGDARDYLKKLIGLLGATFTPSMSGKNTVLIAAYISGNKATKARNWSIPVVNHTWLEDCFIQWRNLSVGLEKYVVFPPGLDFSDHLGERGIQRELILEALPNLIAEMALPQGKVTPVGMGSDHHDGENPSQIAKKLPSARRTKEIEDETRNETVHPMDIDAQSEPEGAREDHMQVDEPAVSRRLMQNSKPKHTGRSGRAREASSPSRQAIPKPQRIHEGTSSSSRRRPRVDSETSERDVPEPTIKKLIPITTRSLVGSPSSKAPRQKLPSSPSKSPATTSFSKLDSVLMPPIGTGNASVSQSSPRQPSATKTRTKTSSPGKAKSKGGHAHRSESIYGEHSDVPPPLSSPTVDTTLDLEEGSSIRRTSRRSAANKASQRLREEVMPDVVNFEKEMRRHHVRVAHFPPKSEREPGQEKTKTRLSAKPLSKGKKRPPTDAVEEDVSSDDEREHERDHKKKRRRLSRVKSHHDRVEDRDDDERTDITGTSSQGAAGAIPSSKGGGAAKSAKVKKGDSLTRTQCEKYVGILATQVTLNESEEKVLVKLGAKVSVRPDECTHLVVKTLARTEKLLCAMAVAPAVITEQWVHDSIAAKKLLPTHKYVLEDPVNEKKWKFNLINALRRAKANKGELFAGKTFYVTNRVPLDKKLLKNVVSAHGGQLRQQNPTVRTLSGNKGSSSGHHHTHYVISCPEDASIWRPIAEAGHPVYSQELILSAALTQEIRLNADDVRIDTR